MMIEERSWSVETYRYGFNEKESDDEVHGKGITISFEFRQYDVRIGRFKSIDPLSKNYPWQSSYLFAANSPIVLVDIMGLGPGKPGSSTKKEALKQIEVVAKDLKQSEYFKNISPEEFISDLTQRVKDPAGLNQGNGTNFCWAAACMSYVYEKDPKGLVDALSTLYTTGSFQYGSGENYIGFTTAPHINDAVGSSTFDDEKDLTNEVDQMLFMALAAYYKGYMNGADKHYDPGDEERPQWSGGNLAKAKAMWNDFGYDVQVSGQDLNVYWSFNKGPTVMKLLKTHDIVLFVNSPLFLRGKSVTNYSGTHYIRVDAMTSKNNTYNVSYWDYGSWKRGSKARRISHYSFWSSTYGIIGIPR